MYGRSCLTPPSSGRPPAGFAAWSPPLASRVRPHNKYRAMPSLTDLQSQLRVQGAPASHLARIRDLVIFAEHEPSVLAIFLVGSYAKGLGDRLSDLDLVAIAAPGHQELVLRAARQLLQSGEVLHQFTAQHSSGGSFWKTVYLDFSSVEFHVFDPSTTFRLKAPVHCGVGSIRLIAFIRR